MHRIERETADMGFLAKLFGGGGPTDAEKAMQADQMQQANQTQAEADQRAALASRAASLRQSLAANDRQKKNTLGG